MKNHHTTKLLHQTIHTFFMQHYVPATTQLLVSVTGVDLSPDGRNAKVAISFMPTGQQAAGIKSHAFTRLIEETMQRIDKEQWELKRFLSQQLGKKIRRIPILAFEWDQGPQRAAKMHALLN